MPVLAIDGAEDRILALLSAAYQKPVSARVLGNIRRAAKYWLQGETHLAAIELALTGLSVLGDTDQALFRLRTAEQLLADGVTPDGLVQLCDDDPETIKAGYNPDQPRVPAGSPGGGQWASTNAPPAALGIVPVRYKPAKEPPNDPKLVIPPDGVPIKGGDPPALLIAPSRSDFRQVYGAGQAIASMSPLDQILHIRAALHQGGTYDFQRDPVRQETQSAYANASNYAVGVYLAGAGYSLSTSRGMAAIYAFFNSSNYGDEKQIDWLEQGWRDATAGRWK